MSDIKINPNISIFLALGTMSDIGEKCLIVVDNNEKLLGTLSDGDLRKAILKGTSINDSIVNIFNKNPVYFREGAFTIKDAKSAFIEHRFNIIPVVDENDKVVDILIWDKVLENKEHKRNSKLNASVVVMAGGKGTRLEPFTKVLPKPLLPINEKPVIEHIIEHFIAFGISKFHITVNYKSRLLKAFFEELQPQYSISFVDESEPLGTAGCLFKLLGKFETPFFVTNCDTIIETDYSELYAYHQMKDNDLTVVVATKNYIIPYGTCELNVDGELDHIKEKPELHFLANTGLYVLSPRILKLIPKGKPYHFTKLIEEAKKQGFRVGVYPVGEKTWIDIGQWSDYQQAVDRFRF